MTGVLLDTNVISGPRRGDRCDRQVAAWHAGLPEADICFSVLVVGEIRKGIERARGSDPAKAEALERWLDGVVERFGQRVLGIDGRVAEEWGRMSAIRSVPVIDALLAATAKTNGLVSATRNAANVQGLGAALLNPLEQMG